MLNEIKRIIIQELMIELQELKDYKKRIMELEEEEKNIRESYKKILEERSELYCESNKLSNRINPFRRNKFRKKIKKINSDCSECEINLRNLKTELENIKNNINIKYVDFINKTKKFKVYNLFNFKSETIDWSIVDNAIKLVSECQSLKQLGWNFYDAVNLLRANNIPIILDESDKKYEHGHGSDISLPNGKVYYKKNVKVVPDLSSMRNYVLVHKTMYYPQNGRIKTTKEASPEEKITLKLDKVGLVNFKNFRNTIHFSVNGEVDSHLGGNWNNSKYAVLIPFVDMPPGQFRSGACMDTYIEGGLSLPKSAFILCPQEEAKMIQEANPQQTVVGYIGENVKEFANAMVEQLGYKVQTIGSWDWGNKIDSGKYYKKLSETGLNIHVEPHGETIEFAREKAMLSFGIIVNMLRKIVEDKILLDERDIEILLSDDNIDYVRYGYDEIDLQIIQFLENELKPLNIIINEDLKNNFINKEYQSFELLIRDLLMQTQHLINNNKVEENTEEISHSK